jgi:exosortase
VSTTHAFVFDLDAPGPLSAASSNIATRRPERSLAPLAAVVSLTIVAYHHSLSSLLRYLRYDTPLAYVALVPMIVPVMAAVAASSRLGGQRLPDRQADWIVGVPLLAIAAAIVVLLPRQLSYSYWTNRIDLVGLPFFVAGTIAIVCGLRVLRRVGVPVAMLVFAWPYPVERALSPFLNFSTDITATLSGTLARVLGLAHQVDRYHYELGPPGGRFTLAISTACGGANSTVGFLLIGGAFAYLASGSRLRRVAWVAVGVVAALLANSVRVLLLFAVADRWGQDVAMKWLHPVLGLGLVMAVTLGMVLLRHRFGLGGIGDGGHPPRRAGIPTMRLSAITAIAIVALAGVFAVQNAALARFDPFLGVSSAGAVAPYSDDPPAIDGWTSENYDEITWAKQYFGSSSSWLRYAYTPNDGSGAVAQHQNPMFVEVVNTGDLNSLAQFGLKSCYQFHSYDVYDDRRFEIGTPAPAQAMSFKDKTGHSWSMVSWVWPVTGAVGKRYERVVLLEQIPDRMFGDQTARRDMSDRLTEVGRVLVAERYPAVPA